MSVNKDIAELKKVASMVNQEILQKNNILPYLLAGGAGALTGGIATAIQPRGKDESRLKRLYRILRNASLMGGAVGGGAALLSHAKNRIDTTLHPDDSSVADNKALFGNVHKAQAYAGLGGAAYLYNKGRKRDIKGLDAFASQMTGVANTDGEGLRKAVIKNMRTGNSPEAALANKTHADSLFAKYLKTTSDANSKVNAHNGVAVVPETSIHSQLRSFGLSPDDYAPGGNKLKRHLADFAHKHGGRLAGRTGLGAAARALGLGAIASTPAAADWALNRSNSDINLYDN